MIMLEEGEIDEEDLDLNQNTQSSDPNANGSDTLKSNNNSPNSLYLNANPQLSPASDHSSSASSSSHKHKRKNRQHNNNNNKINKRKKLNKLKEDLNEDDIIISNNYDQDDNTNDSQSFCNDDKDERFVQSTTTIKTFKSNASSYSWGSPVSKTEKQQQQQQQQHQQFQNQQQSLQVNKQAPISLFDLFKNSSQINESQSDSQNKYFNPVITEKENKPKYKPSNPQIQSLLNLPSAYSITSNQHQQQQHQVDFNKRKNYSNDPEESEMTVSVESIEKKMEKKRKYAEIQKEREKREKDKQLLPQPQKPKIVCHFFLEGRCQKGDKCPFSHEAPKKFELCKFYSNGYCSKIDKCLFMHSEFPCKFFHSPNGQCLNGDKCRFSHEPITNPQLKEAFEKYINQSTDGGLSSQPIKPSLLGTPPLPMTTESIPSLMNLPIKIAKTDTKPVNSPFNFRDVDERNVISHSIKEPLLSNQLLESGDVDLRSLTNPKPEPIVQNDFETVKKELIMKIMKAIADDDGGIFSQIPKQALTELLFKLINSDNQEMNNSITTEAIVTLLATLNAASTSNSNMSNVKSETIESKSLIDDDKSMLNESSSNLQIDLGNITNNKSKLESYDDDDHEDDYHVDEDDDDDYEQNLVIEGNIGEFPYRLIEIEIQPSNLWIKPPVDTNSLNSSVDGSDQESDPRIKYYSNKANCQNVSNFHLKLLEQNAEQIKQEKQQQIVTPTSPSNSTHIKSEPSILSNTTASSPVYGESVKQNLNQILATTKPGRVDPRLASRNLASNLNQSPTRSQSPPSIQDFKIDLISIQNKQVKDSSLLSSLPDLQFPKDIQRSINCTLPNFPTNYLNNDSSSSVNKLSIEDYKRTKLNKPNSSSASNLQSLASSSTTPTTTTSTSTSNNYNFNSITGQSVNTSDYLSSISSLTSIANSNTSSNSVNNSSMSSSSSSLPTIPSYTINLHAPQSLHELLRNFQS